MEEELFNTDYYEETKVLTISGLVSLLSEIEELKGLDISVTEEANTVCISIGDSTYCIESPESSSVDVPNEVVDVVSDIDEEGWDEIADVIEQEDETIEGGLIKEVLKTLAIGGLVRLTKNAIQNA